MADPLVSDRPIFDPGQIICSPDGTFALRIIEHIGEGRCCLVYSAKSIRDGTKVAVKVFKRGPTYDGAVQREQFILENLAEPKNNLVLCYGSFAFNGLNCQVMELLEFNIRQLIFRNDRQGLSPWITQKFAKDLLTSLVTLHESSFAHADLKPANIMWSSYDGAFKLLDFGLTFHTDELDLHQIQSAGYKSPESAKWNKFKDEEKRKRKRKLQGTYSDLTQAAPAFSDGLNELEAKPRPSGPPEKSVIEEDEPYTRRHRIATAVIEEPDHQCDESSNCCKWPSESSGIFTASIQSTPPTSRRQISQDLCSDSKDDVTSDCGASITSSKRCIEDTSQEWRRGRTLKKEVDLKRCPRPLSTANDPQRRRQPPLPNEKADIWSFGCLLVESLTGRKLFSVSDKMATVLRPLQLLEMKLGETEVKYENCNKQRFFLDAKNLIQRCLAEDPDERISAKSALEHSFFTDHVLSPSVKDMVLLPSNVLQLLNVLDDPKYNDESEVKEVLKEVREEAEKYGTITDIQSRNGHAYIEFQEASDCQTACSALTGKTFDERTILAVFYPIHLWSNKVFV